MASYDDSRVCKLEGKNSGKEQLAKPLQGYIQAKQMWVAMLQGKAVKWLFQ